MAWGNIIGTRIEGELIKFETKVSVVEDGWRNIVSTGKEKQRPIFSRSNDTVIVETKLENISIEKKVIELEEGSFRVLITASADSTAKIGGVFFTLELPTHEYKDVNFELIGSDEKRSFDVPKDWESIRKWWRNRYKPVKSNGISIIADKKELMVSAEKNSDLIVLKGTPFWGNPNHLLHFAIIQDTIYANKKITKEYSLTVTADVDNSPIILSLDPKSPGKTFDGIGGNFRLQNPFKDPQVIEYCLNNLNVTWGRVEMPWVQWHNEESVDPIQTARNGRLNELVHQSMLMAKRLAKDKIPVVLSAWSAPDWAIIGERRFGSDEEGLRGNTLNPKKMRSIIKSISSYILFLKEKYGVEPALFSFNESDLGINIRQTGKEHAELIKSLGSHFSSMGLSTKLLLGDNSDANTYEFTTPAIQDRETHKYIGGISFHSWRGYDDWTLSIWSDIANELNIPLMVGEGSTDAAAHSYPEILLEPSYALNEIDVYIRIMNICQARSILQWQLTSDYSVLTGDGIYNTDGPMKPTQRFWQLKQLGLTPKGSFYIPINFEATNISCAALGDIKNDIYTIHIVNNGSTRDVTINNIPDNVNKMKVYLTDANSGMKMIDEISVKNGEAEFELVKTAFTTLISTE
jgi:predicted transcriptional regulator YdeE